MEVHIVSFVTPHFFFVTTKDTNYRTAFLRDLSHRIKRSYVKDNTSAFQIDEIVAVHHENKLVRASIQNVLVNSEQKIYYCWLLDYAVLIQTDTVLKLPCVLQEVPSHVQQASLNNIGYVKNNLELDATGNITTTLSIVPSSGVLHFCVNLFSDAKKMVLNIDHTDGNILIGDITIYKTNESIKLTEELIKHKMLVYDEDIFQCLKDNAKQYLKTHLEIICHVTQHIHINVDRTTNTYMGFTELDEVDINRKPIENGRRRLVKKHNNNLVEETLIFNHFHDHNTCSSARPNNNLVEKTITSNLSRDHYSSAASEDSSDSSKDSRILLTHTSSNVKYNKVDNLRKKLIEIKTKQKECNSSEDDRASSDSSKDSESLLTTDSSSIAIPNNSEDSSDSSKDSRILLTHTSSNVKCNKVDNLKKKLIEFETKQNECNSSGDDRDSSSSSKDCSISVSPNVPKLNKVDNLRKKLAENKNKQKS